MSSVVVNKYACWWLASLFQWLWHKQMLMLNYEWCARKFLEEPQLVQRFVVWKNTLCEKAFRTSCTLCLCYIFAIKSQICCLSFMNLLFVINHVFIATSIITLQQWLQHHNSSTVPYVYVARSWFFSIWKNELLHNGFIGGNNKLTSNYQTVFSNDSQHWVFVPKYAILLDLVIVALNPTIDLFTIAT